MVFALFKIIEELGRTMPNSMDIKRLKNELRKGNVPEDSYTLLTTLKDESLVLEQKGSNWCVFYWERGLRTNETLFSTEEDACKNFLLKISSWFNKKQ